jgi:ADP-ribose pyrophosphatase YjhB (NUDIX family)
MNHELIKHELFQISGKAVLFNKDKSKVVLLRRKDGGSTIPGGHVEPGEMPEDALRREIKEELGIDYDGQLKLANFFDKLYPKKLNEVYSLSITVGKLDIYYVGELDEDAPISVGGSGDDLSGWEWASVDKILNGEYKDERAGVDWVGRLIREVKSEQN